MEPYLRGIAVALLSYMGYYCCTGTSAEITRAIKIVYYILVLGENAIQQHG